MGKRRLIVTICGHIAYVDDMWEVAQQYTELDCMVLMPHLAKSGMGEKQLDDLHKAKIDISDAVHFVHVHNMEKSTRGEYEYTLEHGKPLLIEVPTKDYIEKVLSHSHTEIVHGPFKWQEGKSGYYLVDNSGSRVIVSTTEE